METITKTFKPHKNISKYIKIETITIKLCICTKQIFNLISYYIN